MKWKKRKSRRKKKKKLQGIKTNLLYMLCICYNTTELHPTKSYINWYAKYYSPYYTLYWWMLENVFQLQYFKFHLGIQKETHDQALGNGFCSSLAQAVRFLAGRPWSRIFVTGSGWVFKIQHTWALGYFLNH